MIKFQAQRNIYIILADVWSGVMSFEHEFWSLFAQEIWAISNFVAILNYCIVIKFHLLNI